MYRTVLRTGTLWICLSSVIGCGSTKTGETDLLSQSSQEHRILLDADNYFEAESATSVHQFEKQQDAEASSGAYMLNTADRESPASAASLEFSLTVERAGTYRLWARGRGPNGSSDSVFAQFDDGSRETVHLSTRDWSWCRPTSAHYFQLSTGVHTLRLSNREEGVSVDKLLLTALDTVPSGIDQEQPSETPSEPSDETPVVISAIEASSDDGNIAENVVDGDLKTRWSAKGDGQWIAFTLAEATQLTGIRIAWHRGDRRISDFTVEVSTDGQQWEEVHSGQSSGQTNDLQLTRFSAEALAVRIVGFGNSENAWTSITEVEILGQGSDADPTDPTDPTDPIIPPDPNGFPAQFLGLGNSWKLTLPINTERRGNPDEVYPDELATFVHPTFFHITAAGDGVLFRADTDANSTTSGSKYPRSELREMGFDDGTKKPNCEGCASWSTTKGTHTMEIHQTILSMPKRQQGVVAGQIHDAGDDIMKIQLKHGNDGKKVLMVTASSQIGPALDSDYHLGTPFSVKVVASNGRIKIHYNDQLKVEFEKSTKGCYFKAGAYTQSNADREPGGGVGSGQVVIHSLSIRHQ